MNKSSFSSHSNLVVVRPHFGFFFFFSELFYFILFFLFKYAFRGYLLTLKSEICMFLTRSIPLSCVRNTDSVCSGIRWWWKVMWEIAVIEHREMKIHFIQRIATFFSIFSPIWNRLEAKKLEVKKMSKKSAMPSNRIRCYYKHPSTSILFM